MKRTRRETGACIAVKTPPSPAACFIMAAELEAASSAVSLLYGKLGRSITALERSTVAACSSMCACTISGFARPIVSKGSVSRGSDGVGNTCRRARTALEMLVNSAQTRSERR